MRLSTKSDGLKQLTGRGTGVADQLTAAFRDGASDDELYQIMLAWAGGVPDEATLRNAIGALLVMGGADLAAINSWLRV